jgi:hypothetical protein
MASTDTNKQLYVNPDQLLHHLTLHISAAAEQEKQELLVYLGDP